MNVLPIDESHTYAYLTLYATRLLLHAMVLITLFAVPKFSECSLTLLGLLHPQIVLATALSRYLLYLTCYSFY